MEHETIGSGQRVVLVHGSLATGPQEWAGQRPLADHGYELVVPTRRAYARVPAVEGEDYATDADDVAGLLGGGAHLVGHSSGGLVAMLTAAAHPEEVRSLILAEPPAFAAAPGHPDVARLRQEVEGVYAAGGSDREFLETFLRAVGTPVDDLPPEQLDEWVPLVPALRDARLPWDVQLPLADLGSAAFPVLVVSGGHHPAFTAMCAALADRLGGRHAVVEGAGHEMQMVTEAFNDTLLRFWRQGSATRVPSQRSGSGE